MDVCALALDLNALWIRAVEMEAGGGRRLYWVSRPNTRYQVEYKDSLDASAWTPVGGETMSAGAETSLSDSEAKTTRFYRVRAL